MGFTVVYSSCSIVPYNKNRLFPKINHQRERVNQDAPAGKEGDKKIVLLQGNFTNAIFPDNRLTITTGYYESITDSKHGSISGSSNPSHPEKIS